MEFWPIASTRPRVRKTSATKKKKPPADARFTVLTKPNRVVRAYPKEAKTGASFYTTNSKDGKYKNVSLRATQKTVNSVDAAKKKLKSLTVLQKPKTSTKKRSTKSKR